MTRIEKLLKKWNSGILKKKKKALADKLGVPDTSVSHWIAGRAKPSEIHIKKMAKLFGKTEKQIQTIFSDEFEPELKAVPLIKANTITLPILADVPAGLPEFSEADVETFWDIPRWIFPGADFVVRCIGDSLEPEIHKGDFCVIRKATEPLDGKMMLIKTEDGICMKVIRKAKKSGIWLCSLNPKYKPFQSDELEIIGLILGHWGRADKDTFKIAIPEE